MIRKVCFLFFLTFLLFENTGISQIKLTYPVEREVFQRQNNNTGYINIAGSISSDTDYLLARLLPVYAGSGVETQWKRIANGPFNGTFTAKISGTGGWYKLEIVSYKNGQQTDYAAINKVGIGEVFIVSGQSNAEGSLTYEGSQIGSKEDRISVINYQDILMREELLPFEFTTLDDYNKIGPYNPLPWFWGRLAEKIVKEYNVPVSIFGCANGGTSSAMWFNSMNGEDLTQSNNVIIKFAGSPYQIIARTLQNYISRTGARAILWQQGESDYYTSPFDYYNRIKDVSLKTSEVIDSKMSWIIAIASRTPGASDIAYAQQLLINTQDHIYQGPNTDEIFGSQYRYDGIHFHKEGLNKVADAWFNAIKNGKLLSNISPVAPKDLINLNISCINPDTKNLSFSTSGSYDTYSWSEGTASSNLNTRNSNVSLKVKKNGITLFSPVFIRNENEFVTPNISIIGPSTFCEGNFNTFLSSNKTANFKWNNSETTVTIKPQNSGSYYITAPNIYGCELKSNVINIGITQKPIPTLKYANNIPYYCQGESIKVGTNEKFANYNWDNIGVNENFTLNNPGKHFVIVKNGENCKSDSLFYTINEIPKPKRPILSKKSPFVIGLQFQEDANVKSINWTFNDIPLSNTTDELYFNQTGIYKTSFIEEFELEDYGRTIACISETSDPYIVISADLEKNIIVYPNPTTDFINIESKIIDVPVQFSIINTKGETVQYGTRSFKDIYSPIYIKNLTTGVYTLKMKQGDFSENQKLIVIP